MEDTTDVEALPLPASWPVLVKRALVLVNSFLKGSFDIELGRRFDCASFDAREHAACERLREDHAATRTELELVCARLSRLAPNKRTQYTKAERLKILELKARRGWSASQTAERFLVDEDTVRRWIKELIQLGEDRLLEVHPPVNAFPAFVDRIVGQIAVALPEPTKRRVASILARAGLHMAASTVADRLRSEPPSEDPCEDAASDDDCGAQCEPPEARTVAAHYENHVWNVDFTAVPTGGGFWTALPPFSWLQCWPFCFWVAVAVDMFSRKAMGFAVFKNRPTSHDTQTFLDRVIAAVGRAPRYLVVDRGSQFTSDEFKGTKDKDGWAQLRGITPRFGAVGKYGSIAVIERFNRTLKHELLKHITIPYSIDAMREELRVAIEYYNAYRPHAHLNGRTPDEVYFDRAPANERPRFEPRARWPREAGCARPYAPVRGPCGVALELEVSYLEGRRHLPIFRLKEAS